MATRDTTDSVGHSYDRETKGNGSSNNGSSICSATQTYGCTTAKECQYKRTDAFSNVLFHVLLFLMGFV